jgi:hypothetical protein
MLSLLLSKLGSLARRSKNYPDATDYVLCGGASGTITASDITTAQETSDEQGALLVERPHSFQPCSMWVESTSPVICFESSAAVDDYPASELYWSSNPTYPAQMTESFGDACYHGSSSN